MDAANIACTVPFRYGRIHGDRFTCPDCGREWTVGSDTGAYLPFGDHTWLTAIGKPTFGARIFGSPILAATRFQPEPPPADQDRITRLQHQFTALGLPPQMVLTIYDNNPASSLAYHGAAHGVATALRAVTFGLELGVDRETLRAIAVAALFHDADYDPGVGENHNIARAAAFALEYGGQKAEAAAALIPATAHPHTPPGSLAEGILQDADVLQCFDDDRPRWLAALETEGFAPSATFPEIGDLHTTPARRYRTRGL